MNTEVYTVQAILFDKRSWKTPACRKWLRDHEYTPIKKVHVTPKLYRYRITEPNYNSYITKRTHNGIYFVLGKK